MADLVLMCINGHTGFEMETFEFLNVMQVWRLPPPLLVVTSPARRTACLCSAWTVGWYLAMCALVFAHPARNVARPPRVVLA